MSETDRLLTEILAELRKLRAAIGAAHTLSLSHGMRIVNGMKKQDAIDHFGGVPALATVLGITRSAIYQWPEDVPETSAFKIESITGGKLKAIEDVSDRTRNEAAA